MRKNIITALFIFSLINGHCQPLLEDDGFNYDLMQPETIIELPQELDEISGLAYYQPGQLLAVDDEESKVFVVAIQRQKIIDKIEIGKKRDYEGIAFASGQIFVLESDGDIFIGQAEQNGDFDKQELPLSREQDMEGLTYDFKEQRLVIASKEGQAGNVQIFQRSLKTVDAKVTLWLSMPLNEGGGSFRRSSFRPSAIALHPVSNMVYVLSSADQSLALINGEGKVKQIVSLPKRLYPQAEGLCFSPDGILYISNEEGKGASNILVFHPQ